MKLTNKKLGQSLLKDQISIKKIVEVISPKKEDNIVEVGPGLGAITTLLQKNVGNLTLIEIDHFFVKILKKKFYKQNITITECNALKYNLRKSVRYSGDFLRICGNLPFNIGSNFIYYVMKFINLVQDMHFLL